jgi:dephospho-CoA kinase
MADENETEDGIKRIKELEEELKTVREPLQKLEEIITPAVRSVIQKILTEFIGAKK